MCIYFSDSRGQCFGDGLKHLIGILRYARAHGVCTGPSVRSQCRGTSGSGPEVGRRAGQPGPWQLLSTSFSPPRRAYRTVIDLSSPSIRADDIAGAGATGGYTGHAPPRVRKPRGPTKLTLTQTDGSPPVHDMSSVVPCKAKHGDKVLQTFARTSPSRI